MPDTSPAIDDYGLIGDCHTAALVSREGSIDWCCLPRFDSGSAFGRMLDASAGHFKIAPADQEFEATRRYIEDTLVLETTFRGRAGTVSLLDCLAMPDEDRRSNTRRLMRVIEGRGGRVELQIQFAPRFDYGDVRPWVRRHGDHLYSVIGGNDALIVWSEVPLEEHSEHELSGRIAIDAHTRVRLLLTYTSPELIDERRLQKPVPVSVDRLLDATTERWRAFARTLKLAGGDEPAVRRSGIVLKALTHTATGAMVAAPTTSLPEALGGPRNWDYRYAWVRDSSFASRALAELGAEDEADAFRAFIMRSAAGHADDLQVLYGVGGERRLAVQELRLCGHCDSTPVRVGNAAAGQRQLDSYGELVNLTWRWHRRGHSPDEEDWRFLTSLIEHAGEQWSEPDHGIWEWPGAPDHFVHSKVLCWSALDRGIRLAEECDHPAPLERWQRTRDEIRDAIERRGYDPSRGTYVQAFDRPELDAALLLLPTVEYVDWRDEQMVRTVAAIREELDAGNGLLYRYRRDDGLGGQEGAFLCCSFWLTECLARQGQTGDARSVFDRAVAAANDLGLFSEEVDPGTGEARGNYPQALTHLSHISAAVALHEMECGDERVQCGTASRGRPQSATSSGATPGAGGARARFGGIGAG
jgi:GH15 family glucan-1,4-alpha-glucosidase